MNIDFELGVPYTINIYYKSTYDSFPVYRRSKPHDLLVTGICHRRDATLVV